MFEEEGNLKKNKVCLTNLVTQNFSCLSLREYERVRIAHKASQALGTHSTSDFKAAIRVNLTRDNKATTEDVALFENAFGLDISGFKGKTTRSKPLPAQSQATDIK